MNSIRHPALLAALGFLLLPPPSHAADPIPELAQHLDAHLAARSEALDGLASRYAAGLRARINQAADAGDLALATAHDQEKARVQTLRGPLGQAPKDVAAAVRTWPSLPALAEGTPDGLVEFRLVWETERGKIRAELDGKLAQSLQALEVALTKERRLEEARAVLAFRESLREGSAGTPARNEPRGAATKEQPFKNSLGMKFMPVEGTGVLFCIHETRFKDYAAYAGENPGIDGAWRNQTLDNCVITERPEDHPVVRVSWEEAQKFCEWLSKKEGKTYRLPTDEEWSHAVGLGGRERRLPHDTPRSLNGIVREYPWGAEWPPPAKVGNYSDQSHKAKVPRNTERSWPYLDDDDGYPTTAPVMSYAPNRFGLYDMGGNVRELVEDWFDEKQERRTNRGGSWFWSGEGFMLSSNREAAPPATRSYHHGFRLVLVADGGGKATAATPPPAPEADRSVRAPATDNLHQASKERPFMNSLGMRFVPVPGTKVLFCIHETRFRDYFAYAMENPDIDKIWRNQTFYGFIITDRPDDHPVTHVSRDDAKAFCEWLGRKEGKIYRLPTDEEWSIAVGLGGKERRSGDDTPQSLAGKVRDEYPWGSAWPPPAGAGNYGDQSRKAKAPREGAGYLDGYDDGFPTTAPVMSFAPNGLGLHDLGGNMWEWLEDSHTENQGRWFRRGGGWGDHAEHMMRSSARENLTPSARFPNSGFRVVLVADAASAPAQAGAAVTTPPAPEVEKGVRAPASGNPQQASKERPFANHLGMKFVPVPGTKVLFCIHETRYKDYFAYAGKNSGIDNAWRNQTIDGFTITDRTDDHPVCKVNWADSKAFCEWLSKEEGHTYRLPTDEEWSHAVGLGRKERRSRDDTPRSLGGKIREYPWGMEWPPPAKAGNYSDQSRKTKAPLKVENYKGYLEDYDDGFPTTAPVMSFAPNRLGLYDLGGNVWEWIEDWFDEQQKLRFRRGGCWTDSSGWLLSSSRADSSPTGRGGHTGFRIVLELP